MIGFFRFLLRNVLRLVALCVLAVAVYAGLALGCALLPESGRAQFPIDGDAPAFVCATPVHTDLVLTIKNPGHDWRKLLPNATADAPDDAYIAIGWGDYGIFHDVPRWADLTPGKVMTALGGRGPATLRAAVVAKPEANGCQRITLDRAGQDSIARFVLASLDDGSDGKPRVLDALDGGGTFYAAKGAYSPWNTCNVWTGEALAAAGLRHAVWSPFSFGVTWPLQ